MTLGPTSPRQARRLGAAAQFALLSGPLLSMIDSSVMNVAVQPIVRETGAALTTVQWTITGYMLALGTGLALTGFLARRFGTLPVYGTGVVAFTVASGLCAVAPTVGALVAARALQGLAGATLVPLAMSMLLGGEGATGAVSPIAGMLLFLGPALGPSLGGLLIGVWGWRSVFVVNLPIGVLAALAVRRIPRDVAPPRDGNARLDLVGLALLVTGLLGVLYGLDQGAGGAWSRPTAWLPLVAGAALLVGYGLAAARSSSPVLDLRILRDRDAGLSFALCAAASVAAWSIVFLLPVFLQAVQGRTALATGLALLPQGVLTGLGTVLGQRVADRAGVRWTVTAGFVVLVAASLGLSAIVAGSPLWLTATVLAARSAAIGLVITPLLTVVNARLRPDEQADANTTFTVVQRIAGSFGIGLLATMFATRSAAVGPVAALHEVGFVVSALALLAAAASRKLPAVAGRTARALPGSGR